MDEKNKEFVLPCMCGCGAVHLTFSKDEDAGYLYVDYWAAKSYSEQESIFKRIKRQLSGALSILKGKSYFLYDLVIDSDQFQLFKKWVSDL